MSVPSQLTLLAKIASAPLKTQFGEFEITVFHNGKEEVVALTKGQLVGAQDVLCRIHSECVTAHDFFSTTCDCREQMERAQRLIQKEGTGIVIFLKQEGRGNGLAAHIASLAIKMDRGVSQDAAYEAVGFPADGRSFYLAPQVLSYFGIKSVRLISSNLDKKEALRKGGIEATGLVNYTGTTLVMRREMRIQDVAKINASVVTKAPNRRRFFVFGDLNVDEIMRHPGEIGRKGIIFVEAERQIGGTAYNAATSLAEHGLDVVLYGRIGRDSDGEFVRQGLELTNLTAILFESEKPTGHANLHYFGERIPDRLLFHIEGTANEDNVAEDVVHALGFYQADAHDFVFLPCHILQREKDMDKLSKYFDALTAAHSRLVLDLVPHDLDKYISSKNFLRLVKGRAHMIITELRTLAALLGIRDSPEEPTDAIIQNFFEAVTRPF